MPVGIKGFQKGHKPTIETREKISKALSRKVGFSCDMCGAKSTSSPSHYNKKKRHFCSTGCYSMFRRTRLPKNEQHAWKGGVTQYEAHRRYVAKNPERIAHLKARRYAREKGAEGSHTLEEWKAIKDSCGNVCIFCGSNEKLTKDHIIPLSKGGSDYIENIQPLCKSCNSKKHNHIYENPELLNNG